MLYATSHPSPLGELTLASDGENLIGLWIDGQKYFPADLQDSLARKADLPVFCRTKQWLDAYFAGERPAAAALPLAPAGTAFRKTVWGMLCEIPYGEYTTYGKIAVAVAARTGRERMSAQAVGGAVGHNPISIIIPCHRVVGTDGNLTGYAGGIEKKVALLTLEGVAASSFRMPRKGTAL